MRAKKEAKKNAKALVKALRRKRKAVAKAKKKKWSKGKTHNKLNNLVLFDLATYDKLVKEVPTCKLTTPSIISERMKV